MNALFKQNKLQTWKKNILISMWRFRNKGRSGSGEQAKCCVCVLEAVKLEEGTVGS